MFSLLYGLLSYLFRRDEYHVLLLGADNGGKTTLLERLKTLYTSEQGLPPDKVLPTVGLNIARVTVSGSKLILWDLGGAAGLRSIWRNYYDEAHAVVFVADASEGDDERWADAARAVDDVLAAEELDGAPLLVLANKKDVRGAMGEEDTWALLGLRGRPRDRATRVQAVSALRGDGVEEAVGWMVEAVKAAGRTSTIRVSRNN